MRKTPLSPLKKKKTKSSIVKKLYCGNGKMLPNSDYSRRGTSMECLQIGIKTGISIGRQKEFEEIKQRVLKKYSIKIKKRPRKKG